MTGYRELWKPVSKPLLAAGFFRDQKPQFFCPCNILGAAALGTLWQTLPPNCETNGSLSGFNQLVVRGQTIPSPRVEEYQTGSPEACRNVRSSRPTLARSKRKSSPTFRSPIAACRLTSWRRRFYSPVVARYHHRIAATRRLKSEDHPL